MAKRLTSIASILLIGGLALTGCSSSGTDSASSTSEAESSSASTSDSVSVTNCGEEKTYPRTTRLVVNDGNITSVALAAGAYDNIVGVSSLQRDEDIIALRYGDKVHDLNQISEKYWNLENILSVDPQTAFAGWGYGFRESDGLTPADLDTHGISTYLLSETCRQGGSQARGTMDPWTALNTDIENIAKIAGDEDAANKEIADINARRTAIEEAPQAEKTPVTFLFDSPNDSTVFSSGAFGAPQAIFDSAGVENALSDVQDTWVDVSWERITSADPDIIFFVDYPPVELDEKIAALEANPATKDLKAVKEKRYVNLPYAMWTSGPLNIDGLEYVRYALEHYGLQPESGIKPKLDITQLDLPGNEWLKEAK